VGVVQAGSLYGSGVATVAAATIGAVAVQILPADASAVGLLAFVVGARFAQAVVVAFTLAAEATRGAQALCRARIAEAVRARVAGGARVAELTAARDAVATGALAVHLTRLSDRANRARAVVTLRRHAVLVGRAARADTALGAEARLARRG